MIIDSPIISGSYSASGSLNQFGNVVISGSLTVTGSIIGTASFAATASYLSGYVSPFPYTGSAIISGSLEVTGSANLPNITGSLSGSLQGTASYAITASNAVTASYLSGYVSPFPFTGSAIISGSLTVTGSVAVSNLSGSGVRYLVADESGSVTAQSASAALKSTQAFTSTAGQTTFSVTNGYATGYVDVFINGSKLSTAEFTDTSGTNIVLATGSFDGDTVEVVKYTPAAGVTNNVLRQLTSFTASAGQTVFSASYTPGLLDIFYNGSRLSTSDFTANNGTYFTLATGSADNDILDVLVYSYQVGAFSGIGGVGTAAQVAYFGTTNSITGSNNFTIDGSTMTVTGSLIVSGSGTFTNIGPAVFSGSLTSTAGFTGSFSGTATSASYAANADLLDGLDSTVFTLTSSFAAQTASFTAFTASQNILNGTYATTGSNTFKNPQTINSNLTVTGSITAATLVVQTITSSVVYSSGSNIFGNSSSNNQIFTGSMYVTGAFYVTTGSVGIGTSSPLTSFDIRVPYAKTDTTRRDILFASNDASPSGLRISITGGASQKVRTSHLQTTEWGIENTGSISLQPYGGNIGIGTLSPSGKLMLYNSSAGNVIQNIVSNQGGSTQVGISLSPSMTDSEIASNPAQASIYATDYNYGANIIFANKTTGAVGNSLTERMRISSDGNVGVGNSTTTWKLTVAGAADSLSNILGVFNTGITGTSAIGKGTTIVLGGNIDGNYSTKLGMVYEGQNPSYLQPALAFYTMNNSYAYGSEVERMRISSPGIVLIANSASTGSMGQTAMLQVAGGVRATSGLLTVYELGTIAQNTTITQDLPYSGLYLITNGGNNSALIMVTRAGGSRGCQLVSSTNSNADIVVGTTTEPSGGNYLRVWMSAVGTMSIKNLNGYTGPYSMTPITTQ